MGAFLVLMPKSRIEFKYFGLVFLRPFGGEFYMPGWVVMSFWFLKDLFWAILGMFESRRAGRLSPHIPADFCSDSPP